MYQRKYSSTDDNLYNYLENLYEESSHKYINGVLKESDCFEIKKDLGLINEYTGMMEDYINEVVIELDNYKSNIKKLKKIKTIAILNHEKRELYSMTYYKDNIELNPNLPTEKSKKLLYRRFNINIDRVID